MSIIVYTAVSGDRDAWRSDVLRFEDYSRFHAPVLNAKIYKVLAHQFVKADFSIWVDGNVSLNQPAGVFVELLGNSDIAVFRHSERSTIYDEAGAVLRMGKDLRHNVDPQMEKYRKQGWTKPDLGMCFLIIRRHTERIARLNEQWWSEICTHSTRDQLSFPVVFDGVVKYLPALPMGSNKYWTRKPHSR